MNTDVNSAGMKCARGTISPLGIIGIKNENEGSGFFFENEKKEKKSGVNFLEETFAMIKPITASNYGEDIIAVILGHGFEIVQQLSTTLTLQKAEQFYSEHALKGYFKYLTEYMCSGPIVALHLRRVAAVAGWKHLIGYVRAFIQFLQHALYNYSTYTIKQHISVL
jgi:nucleoside diphosphate kinase